MDLDALSTSLLGRWAGVEKKIVDTGYGDEGCYSVERTFTFYVNFVPSGVFSGSLAQRDSDDCSGSTPFTGKWKIKSPSQTIEAIVDQTCYNEETEITGPIAAITFAYLDGRVTQVTIDDSQSEIADDEEHCDDIHIIVCKKE